MVTYHQTFSPSSCDCVFEQEFEHDEETGLNGQPRLLFAHNICSKHEHLVKNKPKLSLADWNKKRQDIAKHKEVLLKSNRDRHINDFDNHPTRKRDLKAIREMMEFSDTRTFALKMDAKLNVEMDRVIQFLDNHEEESMSRMLLGLHSQYALIAQEVYDTIMQGG
jgi:hypothetical protein